MSVCSTAWVTCLPCELTKGNIGLLFHLRSAELWNFIILNTSDLHTHNEFHIFPWLTIRVSWRDRLLFFLLVNNARQITMTLVHSCGTCYPCQLNSKWSSSSHNALCGYIGFIAFSLVANLSLLSVHLYSYHSLKTCWSDAVNHRMLGAYLLTRVSKIFCLKKNDTAKQQWILVMPHAILWFQLYMLIVVKWSMKTEV